jgi:hypothetical protein
LTLTIPSQFASASKVALRQIKSIRMANNARSICDSAEFETRHSIASVLGGGDMLHSCGIGPRARYLNCRLASGTRSFATNPLPVNASRNCEQAIPIRDVWYLDGSIELERDGPSSACIPRLPFGIGQAREDLRLLNCIDWICRRLTNPIQQNGDDSSLGHPDGLFDLR